MNIFPLQNTRLFLRYRHHFDEKKLLDVLKERLETGGRKITDHCIVQDETDEDKLMNDDIKSLIVDDGNNFLHTHVYIKADKIFKNTTNKAFIIEDITPYIVKISSNEHEKAVINYCFSKKRKPETNIENPSIIVKKDGDSRSSRGSGGKKDPNYRDSVKNEKMKEIRSKVYSCKSEQEVLDTFEEDCPAGDINLLLSIWKTKPRDPKPPGGPTDHWYPWKFDLMAEILSLVVDPRKITWFVDYLGLGGKSDFTDYMVDHIEGVIALGTDSMYHLSTTIVESIKNAGEFHTIIFDIPADGGISTGFYESLELIKNGKFTSKKYRGKMVNIKRPNIIVFSNQLPHLWKLSPDRWDLRFLDTDAKVFHKIDGKDLRAQMIESGESKEEFCKRYIMNEIPIKNKELVKIKQ